MQSKPRLVGITCCSSANISRQVLKDEIRRFERNEQRAAEAANLEYLKNVIVKFMESHDEQEQLIPVIGTLLRLSPDEVKRVKTQRALRPAVAQPASALEGWASYLNRWN